MPSLQRLIPHDHPAFDGHFPGLPVLPGVVLLAEVLEMLLADPEAAPSLGTAPKLGAVKFLAPVGPGAALQLQWQRSATGRLQFEVQRLDATGAVIAASGHFEAAA
jgi:3-hydroxyacyl-[acyl-carrier-protein] dehydratase